MSGAFPLEPGLEWLVDAYGCSAAPLRDAEQLKAVFQRAIAELGLHPLGDAHFHTFGGEGGVTGLLMLTESHLTCHSFPEVGHAAFNLYCCRPRPDWPWAERLAELIGAERVEVRRLARGAAR